MAKSSLLRKMVVYITFPLGGRCPSAHTGADEGYIRKVYNLPLISQKSKIFASFSPGRSVCACGAEGTINPKLTAWQAVFAIPDQEQTAMLHGNSRCTSDKMVADTQGEARGEAAFFQGVF